MRAWLAILVLLVPSSALPWNPVVISGGATAAAGGGGPGLTILHQMDFEDSTSTTCEDGASADTCTIVGSADPDCSTGDCPIAGSQSGLLTGTSDKFYTTAVAAQTTGFNTIDFRWRAATGFPASANKDLFGFISALDNFECRISLGNGTLQAVANSGTASTTISVSQDTNYYCRVTYDIPNDDCRLMVSTSAFGATDVGDQTANGSSAGSVVGWQASQVLVTSGDDFVYDDIQHCDGDGGTTQGICGS